MIFRDIPVRVIFDRRNERDDGLCECILGRRTDLRAGSDLTGEDEAAAGAGDGDPGLSGCAARRRAPLL